MSRSRNIKPGFFKNELLVALPFDFRLLFIGLWTMADRKGRMEDRPTKIKMEVFPADAVDVDGGLQALHDSGFISRYTVDGTRYLQVLAWDKHQNPHHREAASTIPAQVKPRAEHPSKEQKPEALPESKEQEPEESPVPASENTGSAVLIPDSGFLIPDSPRKAVERQAARFAEFWAIYPLKKGKAEAEAKWKSRGLDAIADQIIADVKARIARDRDWLDGYVPYGSTYVNGKVWEDEIRPAKGTQHGSSSADIFDGAK